MDQVTVESLLAERDALREEVAQLRQLARVLRSRSLLERAVLDDEMSRNFSVWMDRFFPDPKPWYVCILFVGNSREQPFPAEEPLSVVERIFQPVLLPFGESCFFDASGMVGCLLNLRDAPAADTISRLAAVLETEHRAHQAETGTSHIALSQSATMEEGPKPIYRGALSASERRTPGPPYVFVESPSPAPRQQDRFQLLTLEQTFWRQIQTREFFQAAATQDQMIALGLQERGSLEKTLATVFSRMELVLNAMSPELDQQTDPGSDLNRLLSDLSQVTSYGEMRDVAYDILATLEDRLCTPAGSRNRKMPAIERYIQDHYGDPDLGANSIAEAFKISPSYLSRIFKSDRSVGIVEYIHTVRVDAARHLLTETDLTMDAVAAQVGFSSRGVLSRVFKKQVGMTPGQYRAATV